MWRKSEKVLNYCENKSEKVYRVSKPGIPLKAYMDFSAFKLFMLDYKEQEWIINISLWMVGVKL